MQGVILISHGLLAEGMLDSLKMFFSDNIEAIETLCLTHDMGADEFRNLLIKKIAKVDSDEGVVIFADMLGGTPSNQALLLSSDHIRVVVGMNLPMVMEYLAMRSSGNVNIGELVLRSKDSLIDANTLMLEEIEDVDDD